jgi:hypothetical protein
MSIKLFMMAASAAGSMATAAVMEYFPQQGVPAPGGTTPAPPASGTPSAAPRPGNSQPRTNGPGSNVPNPGQPATTQPATNQPASNQPASTQPAGTVNPVVPVVQPGQVDPGVQPGVVTGGVNGSYVRPFAFQSPAYEARFTDYTRRLVSMEQRLARNNQDLTKRLGEARALTGERQMAATFDILQQMLKEQAALNSYLVRARTAWTGDVSGVTMPSDDEYWSNGQPANGQPVNQQPVSPNGTTTTAPGNAQPAANPVVTVPPGTR